MGYKNINNQLDEIAEVLAVGQDQSFKANNTLNELEQANKMLNTDFSNMLDTSNEIQNMLNDIYEADIDLDDSNSDIDLLINEINIPISSSINEISKIDVLDVIDVNADFDYVLRNSQKYAKVHNIDLSNPYYAGMSQFEISNMNKILSEKYQLSTLDKYDYAFSGVMGIIMGMVDVLFVGSITDGNKNSPGQGLLGEKVDQLYDNVVKKFAKFEYNIEGNKRGKSPDFKNVTSSIRWLENNHKVSYDAANSAHIKDGIVKGMNPSNHHLMSMAHDSGPLGLIFGIIDQLTGKSTFIDGDGHFIRVMTDSFENSKVTEATDVKKIIQAVINWFGHTMSDIDGASGSKGRGAGLPAPFYTLTQKLQFGKFNVNNKDMNIAQLSEWVYKQGLDVRAITTQSIPVILNEIIIRIYWVFKRHFYYGKTWKESMPISSDKNYDLQKMLLTSITTFEFIDIGGAIVQGGGINPKMLLSMNFVGVIDLAFRSFQVIRSNHMHLKSLDKLDEDLQEEWDRIGSYVNN